MIKEADVDGDGEINYTVRNIIVLLLTSGIRQYDSFQIVLFVRDMDYGVVDVSFRVMLVFWIKADHVLDQHCHVSLNVVRRRALSMYDEHTHTQFNYKLPLLINMPEHHYTLASL